MPKSKSSTIWSYNPKNNTTRPMRRASGFHRDEDSRRAGLSASNRDIQSMHEQRAYSGSANHKTEIQSTEESAVNVSKVKETVRKQYQTPKDQWLKIYNHIKKPLHRNI